MTQYLPFVRGDDTLTAGLHSLPYAAATIVVAPLGATPRDEDRTPPRHRAGLGTATAGLVMTAWVDSGSGCWRDVVPAMAVLAAGAALIFAPATEVIMSSLSRRRPASARP